MKLYTIFDDDSGFLGIMRHPLGGQLLNSQMASLASLQINTIVSLLTKTEEQELGLCDESASVVGLGMNFISFPIQDKRDPVEFDAFYKLACDIAAQIKLGHRIIFHCWAGVGRSGLLSAAVLVALGENPSNVFSMISNARGKKIPETQVQQDWFTNQFLPFFNNSDLQLVEAKWK